MRAAAAMMRAGRMASLQLATLWVQDTSIAWTGHDPATCRRHDQGEAASTRSRSVLGNRHTSVTEAWSQMKARQGVPSSWASKGGRSRRTRWDQLQH